jgi:hypothetical protein
MVRSRTQAKEFSFLDCGIVELWNCGSVVGDGSVYRSVSVPPMELTQTPLQRVCLKDKTSGAWSWPLQPSSWCVYVAQGEFVRKRMGDIIQTVLVWSHWCPRLRFNSGSWSVWISFHCRLLKSRHINKLGFNSEPRGQQSKCLRRTVSWWSDWLTDWDKYLGRVWMIVSTVCLPRNLTLRHWRPYCLACRSVVKLHVPRLFPTYRRPATQAHSSWFSSTP